MRRPKHSRWRYWLRRSVLLMLSAGVVAGILFTVDRTSDHGSSPASTPANDPKLAARISHLQRKLKLEQAMQAQANRQSVLASPVGGTTASAPASFSALEHSLPGQVGLAYAAPGSSGVQTIGSLQTGSAWSTIKVALAARVIKDANGASGLSSSQRSSIASAIEASDNAAAMELWDELVSRYGSASGAAHAVTQILASAGDTGTAVSSVGRGSFSPYGQTDWTLAGQARFMSSLAAGCVPGSSYLLRDMSQIISSERWGLGQAGSQAFKGGWGPGTSGGYLVRQMGTLPTRGGTAVVTIAALPSDGQFSTGTEMLGRLADWAQSHLKPSQPDGC